jgi:heterodisulfide reductase subunit A
MPVQVEADMVILETAMIPTYNIKELAGELTISIDTEGWIQEAHPKLRPVETQTGGVFLAGTCQGPKDIPDTVAQASAAAVKVCGLLNMAEMETSPIISAVDQALCSGDGHCENCCPYRAISLIEIDARDGAKRVKRTVADVNSGLCQGCGACAAACRVGAIDLRGYKNAQILREVDALCI